MRVSADAGPLEAAFLQHPARGRVGHARAGLQRLVAEIAEGMVDHGARRFGGVALAPIRHAEPVADLRVHLIALAMPQPPTIVPSGSVIRNAASPPGRLTLRDECLAHPPGGTGCGMRASVLGDAAVVEQRGDRFGVVRSRGARNTSRSVLRTRETDLPEVFRRDSVQQGHRTGSSKSEEGSRHPVSPLWNPCGSAGSTGCRRTSM